MTDLNISVAIMFILLATLFMIYFELIRRQIRELRVRIEEMDYEMRRKK